MRTVLVGESNYAEFEVLNDFLTGKGFKVHWVKSGTDAVNAYDEVQPDLLILDALIPGLTGIKVCQRIKKMEGGEKVRTILLSKVYRQFKEQYESRRTKVGVDAYSEKPVNVAELERVLQQIMPMEEVAAEEVFAPEEPVVEAEEKAPTEEAKRKLGTSGNLIDTPFPRLLFFLHKFKRTGALRVVHEHISKVIYLQKGNPVFVTSNLSNESLGRFMVQRGMISAEDYNSSLERMLATGKQQGSVLLEMGVITPHQLYEALEAQVKEKILRIFAWEAGEYEFRPGVFDIDESMQLNIPALKIIFEGLKRFYTLSRLERYFNEYKNQRLVRVPGSMLDDGTILFRPAEAKFVKLIDGDRSVGKIIARSNLSLTETFQILYFLLLTDVIRFLGDPGFGERSDQVQAAYVQQRRKRRDMLRRLAEDREGIEYDKKLSFRRAVSRMFEVIDKFDYYEIFDLPRTTSVEQIKRAYHQLTRKYHPYDLYNEADDVLKAKSDAIFRALTTAYETLIDSVAREKYDKAQAETPAEPAEEPVAAASETTPPTELETGEEIDYVTQPAAEEEAIDSLDIEWDVAADLAADEADDTSQVLEEFGDRVADETAKEASEVTITMANAVKSELLFQQGEEALRNNDYVGARDMFAQAMALNPKEAEYFAYLGWTTFQERPEDPEAIQKGRDLLEQAISINPGLDSAYMFLGLLELSEGHKDRAREFFEKAVQYNPENTRAQAELKKLEVG